MLRRFLPRFCSPAGVDAQIVPSNSNAEIAGSSSSKKASRSDNDEAAATMGVIRIKPKPGDDAIIHAQKISSVEDEIFLFALDLDFDLSFISSAHRPRFNATAKQPEFSGVPASDELVGYKYEPSSSFEFSATIVTMLRAVMMKNSLRERKSVATATNTAGLGLKALTTVGISKSNRISNATISSKESSAQHLVAAVKLLAHLLITYQEFLQRRNDSLRNDIFQLVGAGGSGDPFDENTEALGNSPHKGNFFESSMKALMIADIMMQLILDFLKKLPPIASKEWKAIHILPSNFLFEVKKLIKAIFVIMTSSSSDLSSAGTLQQDDVTVTMRYVISNVTVRSSRIILWCSVTLQAIPRYNLYQQYEGNDMISKHITLNEEYGSYEKISVLNHDGSYNAVFGAALCDMMHIVQENLDLLNILKNRYGDDNLLYYYSTLMFWSSCVKVLETIEQQQQYYSIQRDDYLQQRNTQLDHTAAGAAAAGGGSSPSITNSPSKKFGDSAMLFSALKAQMVHCLQSFVPSTQDVFYEIHRLSTYHTSSSIFKEDKLLVQTLDQTIRSKPMMENTSTACMEVVNLMNHGFHRSRLDPGQLKYPQLSFRIRFLIEGVTYWLNHLSGRPFNGQQFSSCHDQSHSSTIATTEGDTKNIHNKWTHVSSNKSGKQLSNSTADVARDNWIVALSELLLIIVMRGKKQGNIGSEMLVLSPYLAQNLLHLVTARACNGGNERSSNKENSIEWIFFELCKSLRDFTDILRGSMQSLQQFQAQQKSVHALRGGRSASAASRRSNGTQGSGMRGVVPIANNKPLGKVKRNSQRRRHSSNDPQDDTSVGRRNKHHRGSASSIPNNRRRNNKRKSNSSNQQFASIFSQNSASAEPNSLRLPAYGVANGVAVAKGAESEVDEPGDVTIIYKTGDTVDGLCTLPNGSRRWFPGLVVEVYKNGKSSKDFRYKLQFNDGDLAERQPPQLMRHTKRRRRRRSIGDDNLTADGSSVGDISMISGYSFYPAAANGLTSVVGSKLDHQQVQADDDNDGLLSEQSSIMLIDTKDDNLAEGISNDQMSNSDMMEGSTAATIGSFVVGKNISYGNSNGGKANSSVNMIVYKDTKERNGRQHDVDEAGLVMSARSIGNSTIGSSSEVKNVAKSKVERANDQFSTPSKGSRRGTSNSARSGKIIPSIDPNDESDKDQLSGDDLINPMDLSLQSPFVHLEKQGGGSSRAEQKSTGSNRRALSAKAAFEEDEAKDVSKSLYRGQESFDRRIITDGIDDSAPLFVLSPSSQRNRFEDNKGDESEVNRNFASLVVNFDEVQSPLSTQRSSHDMQNSSIEENPKLRNKVSKNTRNAKSGRKYEVLDDSAADDGAVIGKISSCDDIDAAEELSLSSNTVGRAGGGHGAIFDEGSLSVHSVGSVSDESSSGEQRRWTVNAVIEEDDEEKSEEDRIFEIPSVFDGGHRSMNTYQSKQGIVPPISFDELNMAGALPHTSSNVSLSGALLNDSSTKIGLINSQRTQDYGSLSGRGGAMSQMTSHRSGYESLHHVSNGGDDILFDYHNSDGDIFANGTEVRARGGNAMNVRSVSNMTRLNLDVLVASANILHNTSNVADDTLPTGMTRPLSYRMNSRAAGNDLDESGGGTELTLNYFATQQDRAKHGFLPQLPPDEALLLSQEIAHRAYFSSTRHRAAISSTLPHHRSAEAVIASASGTAINDPADAETAKVAAAAYLADAVENDASTNHLIRTFCVIAVIILQRCITNDGLLDESCCRTSSNPLNNSGMSNVISVLGEKDLDHLSIISGGGNSVPSMNREQHPLAVSNSFMTNTTPLSDGKNSDGAATHSGSNDVNMLFTAREYIELLHAVMGQDFVKGMMSIVSSLSPAINSPTVFLLKLLHESFFDNCLLEHIKNSDKIGEGGFGSVHRVICSGSCRKFQKYENCYACYQALLEKIHSNTGERTWTSYVGQCQCWRTSTTCNAKTYNQDRANDIRVFAVKRMSRERSEHDVPVVVDLFNEVTALRRLSGNISICALEDFGVHGAEYWMVMENGGLNLLEWRQQFMISDVNEAPANGWTDARSATQLTEPYAKILSKKDVAVCLSLFLDALYALKVVHDAEIAHFDIKCSNFILRENPVNALTRMNAFHKNNMASGVLFLADFGEAALIRRNDAECNVSPRGVNQLQSPSTTGAAVPPSGQRMKSSMMAIQAVIRCRGTLTVQSPEMLCITDSIPDMQLSSPSLQQQSSPLQQNGSSKKSRQTASRQTSRRNLPAPDQSSDIWSMGCLLSEILLGDQLFAGKSWPELFISLCMQQFNKLDLSALEAALSGAALADCSEGVIELVRSTLRQHPNERIQLSELIIQVNNLLQKHFKAELEYVDEAAGLEQSVNPSYLQDSSAADEANIMSFREEEEVEETRLMLDNSVVAPPRKKSIDGGMSTYFLSLSTQTVTSSDSSLALGNGVYIWCLSRPKEIMNALLASSGSILKSASSEFSPSPEGELKHTPSAALSIESHQLFRSLGDIDSCIESTNVMQIAFQQQMNELSHTLRMGGKVLWVRVVGYSNNESEADTPNDQEALGASASRIAIKTNTTTTGDEIFSISDSHISHVDRYTNASRAAVAKDLQIEEVVVDLSNCRMMPTIEMIARIVKHVTHQTNSNRSNFATTPTPGTTTKSTASCPGSVVVSIEHRSMLMSHNTLSQHDLRSTKQSEEQQIQESRPWFSAFGQLNKEKDRPSSFYMSTTSNTPTSLNNNHSIHKHEVEKHEKEKHEKQAMEVNVDFISNKLAVSVATAIAGLLHYTITNHEEESMNQLSHNRSNFYWLRSQSSDSNHHHHHHRDIATSGNAMKERSWCSFGHTPIDIIVSKWRSNPWFYLLCDEVIIQSIILRHSHIMNELTEHEEDSPHLSIQALQQTNSRWKPPFSI